MRDRTIYAALLEHAATLFSKDEPADAEAVLAIVSGAFPDDINLQHRTGIILREGGRLEKAIVCFQQLLRVHPNFVFSEIELAVTYEAAGRIPDAIAQAEAATRSAPQYGPAFLCAAQILRRAGRHHDALEKLRAGFANGQADPGLNNELIDLLIYHNLRPEALAPAQMNATRADASEHDHRMYVRLLGEVGLFAELVAHCERLTGEGQRMLAPAFQLPYTHARLAARYQRDSIIARAKAREASDRWQSAEQLLIELRRAIVARQPYSFIRMGDGEARFLLYASQQQAGRLDDTVIEIGNSIWRNWFDTPIVDADPAAIRRVHAAIDHSLQVADVIGLPTAQRLAIDFSHFGYLASQEGYIQALLGPTPAALFTNASVPERLHRLSPFLRDLLGGLPFLGVISCHAALAPRLAAHLGIGSHRSWVVPAEMRLPDSYRQDLPLPHFPDMFERIMADLTVPFPGAVFVIGAGLLGKIYAARVKELGGVVFDLGAILDGWMGMNSRPGAFDRLDEWQLPVAAVS